MVGQRTVPCPTCIVNTALLKKLPKKVKSLRGYHADTGEMNQEAFFAVSDYITNSISPLELLQDMQLAADFEASKGIGLIHTVSGVGFMLNLDISMETWFAKSVQNGLQIRIFPSRWTQGWQSSAVCRGLAAALRARWTAALARRTRP